MTDVSNKINLINKYQRLLQPSSVNDGLSLKIREIEKEIKYSIPISIQKLIENSKEVNNELMDVFGGYEIHSIDEIESIYLNKQAKLSFFGEYSLDEKFNVTEDESIDMNIGGGNSEKITDISRFFPLFRHRGDYIVIDLEADAGLVEIQLGCNAELFAPSLDSHFKDLKEGLESEMYKINSDGEIVFPFNWCMREKLKAGLIKMDQYGDIIEPDENMNVVSDIEYPNFVKKWLQKWNNK